MQSPLTPSQALSLWRKVLVTRVAGAEPDLTERQMAILLTVHVETPPHTVRGLASGLKISKPAVTRALDTLGRLGYVQRKRDAQDRRNVLVNVTDQGRAFLGEFSETMASIFNASRD